MNRLRFAIATIVIAVAGTVLLAADPPAPAPAPGLKRGPGYLGSLLMYRMKDCTVVYPAGPGEDVARNKRSAEARARFLQSVHGVSTRVVADVDATPADRNGNLLVLGWGNALLDGRRTARPFRPGTDAIVFLGEPVGEPGDDLLIFNRSPFNRDRLIVFWSRIDPERDRFMPLPRVGSDWAVIRDFRAVRQGMFVATGAWPPVRDPESEADHRGKLLDFDARYQSFRSEHFTVQYESARVTRSELDAIVKAREAAYAKAVAALGAPRMPLRITLWVHEDEKVKKDFTGVDDMVHTLAREAEIHTTRRAARAVSAREEVHVVARSRIGPAYASALYEGLGIAVDGSWRGQDLDLEAALLTDSGTMPSLTDLLDEERFRKISDGPGLPAAALFVNWLRATQSAPAFAAVYGLPDASPATVAKALGRSSADIEAEFRGWVAERAAAQATGLQVAKAEAEAKERLTASDYEGAAAALDRAHAARPDDPQILFNYASALMRTPRLDDAEAAFRGVLALPLGPRESRFRIFSLYQIGRILDIKGQREAALSQYRQILELPDEKNAHELARERIASPATREQLE